MSAYYNEIDPYAAQWLRNLIQAGHIAPGEVDERSIEDVRPDDLRGFVQCHFFAGLGGWSAALRLAGWPDSRPVWTGSCPCQPFSTSGKGEGFADDRHLWPDWFYLIGHARPDTIFGEQVASRGGLGWLDHVRADLETADYACGAIDLCAAGVGAPHLRQRLYFVADADIQRQQEQYALLQCGQPIKSDLKIAGGRTRPGFWDSGEWSAGADGKARLLKPGLIPVVDGLSSNLAAVRALGNAIVPQVAAAVVSAYMECRP